LKKAIFAGGMLAVFVAAAVVIVYETRAAAQDRNRLAEQAPLLTLVGPGSSIGVTVRDADAGVLIDEVRGDTPAARAGLRQGDIVAEFDGERTRSVAQFTRLVRETAPGRTVKMTVVRDGKRTTVDIAPDTRRADDLRLQDVAREFRRNFQNWPRDFTFEYDFPEPGFSYSPRRLGVTVTPISDQLAGYFGVKDGVLVSNVAAGSPAESAGLKAGDVITSVRGHAVSNPSDVTRELRDAEAGASVEIRVMRDRKELALTAKMPERTRSLGRGGLPV